MAIGKWVLGTAVAAGLALSGQVSSAATVLSDNFDSYNNADLVGQGSWGQTGTSTTNPIQVTGSTDKVASLVTTGQDVFKAFTSTVSHTDGVSIFTGATISLSAAQANGDYFLHLSDPAGTTTNFYQRVFAKSSGAGYVLGLLDTSGTGSTTTYGTTELSFGTEYRVVISWDFVSGTVNDQFQLYVNPTSSTEGSNTAYLTHTWTSVTAEPAQLAAVNLRQGSSGNAATPTVDDLIVATTFAEAAAIPEPASLALISAGLFMIARRRRSA